MSTLLTSLELHSSLLSKEQFIYLNDFSEIKRKEEPCIVISPVFKNSFIPSEFSNHPNAVLQRKSSVIEENKYNFNCKIIS